MPPLQPDVLAESRRTYWRLINFGVVAVARASGAGADEPLFLRCECGGPGCVARVRVTRGEYERAETAVVRAGHAGVT
jgi:hypothetical protein